MKRENDDNVGLDLSGLKENEGYRIYRDRDGRVASVVKRKFEPSGCMLVIGFFLTAAFGVGVLVL